jgi:hypothetical protein
MAGKGLTNPVRWSAARAVSAWLMTRSAIAFNQGAMPHEMFVRNLQRIGTEVLPAIQAHAVTTVPMTR